MKDFVIKVQTDEAQKALVTFFNNYKVNIGQFLNELIKANGTPVDAEVKVTEDTIEVFQLAPDKGFVLGEVDDSEIPVQVMAYKNLAVNKRYLVQENDRIILYWKRGEGTPDVRLGQFKTISDSISAFNSEGVKAAMTAVMNIEKRDLKFIKRKQRLGKTLSQSEQEALDLANTQKLEIEEATDEEAAAAEQPVTNG